MKTKKFRIIIPIIMILSAAFPLLAQTPQSFNYQAIVRDAGGEPLADQQVAIQVKLHQGTETGTLVYTENHLAATSPLGLVNLEIGKGTPVSGNFAGIAWETGLYYVEIGLDPAGGTSFVSMGTTRLVSVPYALFSEKTGQVYTAGSGIDISDHTITNTAPDQAVFLNEGTGIDVTGTYPTFTLTNTLPNQIVLLNNGAGINVTGTYPNFTINNTLPDQVVSLTAGNGITLSNAASRATA